MINEEKWLSFDVCFIENDEDLQRAANFIESLPPEKEASAYLNKKAKAVLVLIDIYQGYLIPREGVSLSGYQPVSGKPASLVAG